MAMDGECITQLFYLVPKSPDNIISVLPLAKPSTKDCCNDFQLSVLADIASGDEFKNDVSGIYWWFDNTTTGATMKLLKYDDKTNTYIQAAVLNNNDYGQYFFYGFFVNAQAEKFVGYKLDWRKVLQLKGSGSYKLRVEYVNIISGTLISDTLEYCLRQYTPAIANGTIRIEYYLNQIYGISNNDYLVKDFGNLNAYNSFRLKGFFGYPVSTYTKDYIRYESGALLPVEDSQEPEYIMKLKPIPAVMHDILKTDVFQSEDIYITDYNANNALNYIKKKVHLSSDYPPAWKPLQSKLAGVEIKLKQAVNNLIKRRG